VFGIQYNEAADALAMEKLSILFLGPEAAVPISQCLGRLKTEE
jgi:hypothetical protein